MFRLARSPLSEVPLGRKRNPSESQGHAAPAICENFDDRERLPTQDSIADAPAITHQMSRAPRTQFSLAQFPFSSLLSPSPTFEPVPPFRFLSLPSSQQEQVNGHRL